ncbi:autotransporter-associated beta strand repeat-containing protein [Methylobacterium sp. Leaf456]|uniref:autotransporter-associated beta strand repeat-containing protein n=1 Tax=Methylobacterium sp. Leaf456 TaxID=1736382 RepID=UPI003369E152
MSGVGSGAGGPTRNGSGTTVLSASDTYIGATTVNAGPLVLRDSSSGISGSEVVHVAAGATFDASRLGEEASAPSRAYPVPALSSRRRTTKWMSEGAGRGTARRPATKS